MTNHKPSMSSLGNMPNAAADALLASLVAESQRDDQDLIQDEAVEDWDAGGDCEAANYVASHSLRDDV